MKPSKLYRLTWPLIYGGVLLLLLGVSTVAADAALGGAFVAAGALLAAVGVLAIYLRSRITDPED